MTKVVALLGPIKHWWDENWDTPEKKEYFAWRDELTDALKTEFLVYRGDMAFKGPWDETAQVINDFAIRNSDFAINMTPKGVPSIGTENELILARNLHIPVFDAPPGSSIDYLLLKLRIVDNFR